MTEAREIITKALDEASEYGHPLWRHHECYEPELRAMAAAGECVHFSTDYYDHDSIPLGEQCTRGYSDLSLVGWWRPSALVARLEKAARSAEFDGRCFHRVESGARHAADLRAAAARVAL